MCGWDLLLIRAWDPLAGIVLPHTQEGSDTAHITPRDPRIPGWAQGMRVNRTPPTGYGNREHGIHPIWQVGVHLADRIKCEEVSFVD